MEGSEEGRKKEEEEEGMEGEGEKRKGRKRGYNQTGGQNSVIHLVLGVFWFVC